LPQAPRLSAIALRWLSGSGLKSCPQGQLHCRSYSLSALCTTRTAFARKGTEVVYRSLKSETIQSTKPDRFRTVEIGPGLCAVLRD
jgi:hypothetical protein